MMKRSKLLFLVPIIAMLIASLGMPVSAQAQSRCSLYVSTSGSDNNPGTFSHPWRKVQKAADTAGPGQTVCVRAGVYKERVKINVTGSASGGPVIFQSYPGETAVLDGTGLSVPSGWGPMVWIDNQSYITVQNFEIRNYKSSAKDHVPIGIFVSGSGDHIELRGNRVHNIETLYKGSEGGDAHGIAIYGTAAPGANIPTAAGRAACATPGFSSRAGAACATGIDSARSDHAPASGRRGSARCAAGSWT